MITNSLLYPARPAPPLSGIGQGNPLGSQSGDVPIHVEVGHFDLAAVDDEDDVVDGDRRFGDVGGDHDLAGPFGRSENTVKYRFY